MKGIRICFIGIFVITLLVFFANTITSNKPISDVEKRDLAMFPRPREIKNSDYFDKVTLAFSDQLYKREDLVRYYYYMQFQRYLGDVVEGKDGEMFSAVQYPQDIDDYTAEMMVAIEDLNKLSEELKANNAQLIFLSIPRKDAYMEEYLPKTYTSSRERYNYGMQLLRDNLNSDIVIIDGLEVFNEHKDEYHYYFKTDHHINVRGGELLYKEVMKEVSKKYDVKTYELEDLYEIHKATVNGSFNKQVGQSVELNKEELYLTLKDDFDYTRYEWDVVSDLPVWGKGMDYAVSFMSGDRGYTRIETNREKLPNVMYVGSSFTNVLEALTIPSVNRMVSIDYRNNGTGTSIVDYVKKNKINYVVLVPAQSNNALDGEKIELHIGN